MREEVGRKERACKRARVSETGNERDNLVGDPRKEENGRTNEDESSARMRANGGIKVKRGRACS